MHPYFKSNNGHSTLNRCLPALTAVVVIFLAACSPRSHPPAFDPKTCLKTIPRHVDGLQVLAGPRSAPNIIQDMVPAICNGQVLFRKMQIEDGTLESGTVIFRVVVEYTGEVKNVSVRETTIASASFIARVSAMIANTDFAFWAREDTDTVFIYPIRFGL